MIRNLIYLIILSLIFATHVANALDIQKNQAIINQPSPDSDVLTLEKAMDKAEANFKALGIATEQVRISRNQKYEQIFAMLPNVYGNLNYNKPIGGVNVLTTTNVSDSVALPTNGTAFTGGVTLNQPITELYGFFMSLGKASAQLRAAMYEQKRSAANGRYLGASSFINCTKAFQLIKVANNAIETAQKQLTDAQARFDEGLLTNADLLKVRLNLDNARKARVQAETTYQITLITLSEAIGEDNPESIKLPEDYKSVMEAKKHTIETPSVLLKRELPLRSDILASQENITAQRYAKYHAIGSYLPLLDFQLVASRNFLARDTPHYRKSQVQDSVTYGAILRWDILDWGVRQTRINAASAMEQIARLELQQTNQRATIDIVTNYNKLEEAYESLRLTKLSVEYAESVYKQRLDEFQNGFISSTDLVIASDDQTTARANYINAIGDLDLAWMTYFRSTRHYLTTLN